MSFVTFKKKIQERFTNLSNISEHLFEVDVDKDKLWDLYLDSYPAGTNEIYRERREHDCSCCRQFVRNIGNIVAIVDNKILTIWDLELNDSTYQPVADALNNYIKSKVITDVFISKESTVGTNKNHERLPNGEIKEWEHFYLDIPRKFVDKSRSSEAEIKGTIRDTRNVFKRSLDEFSVDSLLTILELIAQNSLYKGEEWQYSLNEFLRHKRVYAELSASEKANYAWVWSAKVIGSVGRIRNTSIGTLLIDLSEGMDLDTAVRKYEKVVAPENYKRPKAIYTKKMLEDAQKTVQELGYMESLGRRFATLDDITVNNILFSNKDAAKRIGGDVFADMLGDVAVNPKKFSKVEEVTIENFVNDILPTAKEVEVLMEGKHTSNMVSLIAPENKDSKGMLKWGNAFSWAYSGNITDSSMKERVKSAGGNVEGVLRFSIQWNDIAGHHDKNDLDAHCIEPNGNHIYFGSKNNYQTTGNLDVDIQHPHFEVPAVENITWTRKEKMIPGTYRLYVNNFANRGGKTGFRAEIEFDGQVHSFDYDKEVKQSQNIHVADITLDNNGTFTIKEMIPSNLSTREVWGVKTNQFVPVSVVMHSPNYWDEQEGIGHKHYFFMLKGCVNTENPNGFYNEFLKEELMQHKRVFEALGSKMAVKDVEDQLSGLGFSSTKRNGVVVKVKGQTERMVKVNF